MTSTAPIGQSGREGAQQTSEKFYRFFHAEEGALQQQMDRLADTAHAPSERTDATEHCMAGITRLSDEVRDASSWVPAHDQRVYTESIKSLQARLQEIRTAAAPKPKFTFKTSIAKRPSAISLSDAAHMASQQRLQVSGYGHSENPSSNESSMAPTPMYLRSPPGETVNTEDQFDRGGVAAAPGGQEEEWQPDDVEDPTATARNEAVVRKMSFSQATSVNISRQSNTHIILPSSAAHATTTGTLSSLRRCVVDMSMPTARGRPFAGLTLKGLRDSLIVCGHVGGPAHVTKLENTVVVVACRQFRMHECKNCDVYLRVASRPIIEACEGIRFAPLPAAYDVCVLRHSWSDFLPWGAILTKMKMQTAPGDGDVENLWAQVDDFKWLKSEPSPNWIKLPDAERVSEDIWTDTVPGGPGHGLEDILRATGVKQR